MSSVANRTWLIFALCAAVLTGALAWTTVAMLSLQADKARAQADADHQVALSTALWRMDSWLAPQLAQEAVRPYFEYQPYYAQQKSYNRLLGEIGPGEVITPSPLLTYRSDFFPLHFQIGTNNVLTSPQVPVGNFNDLAEVANGVDYPIAPIAQLLKDFRKDFQLEEVRIEGCRTSLQELANQSSLSAQSNDPQPQEQRVIPAQEFASRNQIAEVVQNFNSNIAGTNRAHSAKSTVNVGPLLPVWSKTAGKSRLLYLRRVKVRSELLVQGILTDWPRLRETLLEQIADLFPPGTADLEPILRNEPSGDVRSLATVPAILKAMPLPLLSTGMNWSATHSVLTVAWLGLLVSLIAVGFTMRSTLKLGERRARFASAVTHELRTPLTTFRMYSEMLADDMVQDPAQRKHYLETLKAESDRLSRLVENVLSYSRLEEGRYNTHPESIGLQDLVDRVIPVLDRRTREANLQLHPEVRNDTLVKVDVDAITQVLFNLVDNACKYAPDGERIDLLVTHDTDHICLTIRDYGQGVPQGHCTAIFKPFERGGLDAGNNEMPGIGLGLALALGLAHDLGGRLRLDSEPGKGASFTLEIPTNV